MQIWRICLLKTECKSKAERLKTCYLEPGDADPDSAADWNYRKYNAPGLPTAIETPQLACHPDAEEAQATGRP